MRSAPAIVLVIMGVSGCGKSTLGRRLSARLGWDFFDGDDLHPRANIAKMSAGEPLVDADRAPWLAALRWLLDRRLAAAKPAILACSALKRSHRDALGVDRPEVALLHPTGPPELLAERLRQRRGHFMPGELLESQLAILEDPGSEALILDIRRTPDELCAEVLERLSLVSSG